jgi:hypothetical protein
VYVLLVCAISLQTVTWSLILLLRDLVTPGSRPPTTTTALQIAIVLIGLPVYLIHWLWAQHLSKEIEECGSVLRRLYFYGTFAAFLTPFITSAFDLMAILLRLPLDVRLSTVLARLSPTNAAIQDLVTMFVLTLLWFYHSRVLAGDVKTAPETGSPGAVRRLYIFVFSAAGLTLAAIGIMALLRWMMLQLGLGASAAGLDLLSVTDAIAKSLVGMSLWLVFWVWAQRLFNSPSDEERESVIRKVYLYLAVFVAVLSAVTSAALMLNGFLRRIFDLRVEGDIRDSLSILIVAAVVWTYHTFVLRGDTARASEAPRQAGIRRLYNYLVAGVGLAAFLVGVSGIVSVLIRSLGGMTPGTNLKEEAAFFISALIAGLSVWLLPWRRAQIGAVASADAGAHERRSVVRKIYLYFYLFAATMTILGGMVYIVFRFLSIILGERFLGNLLTDLGQAFAFTLIAAGVWVYHGLALRGDNQRFQQERRARLASLRVVVVDSGEECFGRDVLDGLRRELPGLATEAIGLAPSATETMGMRATQDAIGTRLANAQIIVGPSTIAVAGGAVTAEVAAAIAASPARKLLVPLGVAGWEWVGVDSKNTAAMVAQTIRAIKQIVAGEEISASRSLSNLIVAAVAIILILCVLSQIMPPLVSPLFMTR